MLAVGVMGRAAPEAWARKDWAMESTQAPEGRDTDLGELVYARKHTGTGHTLAAAFVFGVPTLFVSYVVLFVKQNPGVAPMSLAGKLGLIGFMIVLAGGAGLFLFVRGRKGRMAVETYERGVRIRMPSRGEVVFRYADVCQLKRRTLRGALAGVVFVLKDGQSYEIGVHAAGDVPMLNYILGQFGPIDWKKDNSFRIM